MLIDTTTVILVLPFSRWGHGGRPQFEEKIAYVLIFLQYQVSSGPRPIDVLRCRVPQVHGAVRQGD